MTFLGNLVLILLATTLVGHLSARIGIPAVLGQLVVGIVLGPALLNWLQPTAFIHDFAEIGVICLMFLAGIESDLGLLKKYLRPSVLVAVIGIMAPIALTGLVALAFGLPWQESLFVGIIFAATSVSISVAVMKELGRLDGKGGATILGAAVVDDVLAVVLLSLMVGTLGAETATSIPLVLRFGAQALYFVGTFLVVRFIAPSLAKLGAALLLPVGETLIALILCFGMAYVADLVGLSAAVGAFFAGIAIGQTTARHTVAAHLEPIGYAVFIPVFFVSIGLSLSLAGMGSQIGFIAVLTIAAIVSKLLGAGGGARLAGFSPSEAYFVGAGMVSRGEMALIIAQIGYQAHLLGRQDYSVMITVIIVTTLLAPFLLKHAANTPA
ncbi:cation:proton antiporter [Lacticaseibacillus baoqingensis]|uniref:Cation:proton antiporter n=1 Tax=Lacticaseibacillus baoqingensis TaxID=2486013 RepID=A0ABW4E522_9LACO|nr:cation:proton antiporter [Lacticaseibacillus baoqingensis]